MANEVYDSKNDTLDHIEKVAYRLAEIIGNLDIRSTVHDRSKLEDPEKSAFDTATPKLKGLKYGSDEYRTSLREIKPALQHHYSVNSHHPEFYGDQGIKGMSLMDMMEMLCDWKAAVERHDPPNSIIASIDHNKGRFNISADLEQILKNTVKELGW